MLFSLALLQYLQKEWQTGPSHGVWDNEVPQSALKRSCVARGEAGENVCTRGSGDLHFQRDTSTLPARTVIIGSHPRDLASPLSPS